VLPSPLRPVAIERPHGSARLMTSQAAGPCPRRLARHEILPLRYGRAPSP
jgi:hypothetical protein